MHHDFRVFGRPDEPQIRLQLRDGEFQVIKDRANIVRRIFELALEGYGKQAIAYRLNQEKAPSFGKGPGLAEMVECRRYPTASSTAAIRAMRM